MKITKEGGKKMKVTKEVMILRAVEVVSITLIVLGLIFLYLGKWVLAVPFLIVPIGFFINGLKKIPEEERWVVQVFEKFLKVCGPGLVWICPFLTKVRESVSIFEQRYLLFEKGTEREIKIDFTDGSAVPKMAYAYIQVIGGKEWLKKKNKKNEDNIRANIYRVVYAVKNAKEAIIALVENAARSYLNVLTVAEGLIQGGGGYNLIDGMKRKKEEKLKEAKKATKDIDKQAAKKTADKIKDGLKLDETLKDWGFELQRVTIGDFDLDKAIIEARESVLRQKREADGAKAVAQTRARETVRAKIEMLSEATGKKIEDIQKEIRENESLSKEFNELSTDLVQRRMAIEGKSFTDIRVEGAEGGLKDLISLLSVWKRMPLGEKEKEEKKLLT